MFRRLTIEEKQKRRCIFKKNPIYGILYTPLWRHRGEDLSPEEVWIEGNNLALLIKEFKESDCKIRVREAFDDLCQRFSIFIEEDGTQRSRNQQQAEHSAMMVSLASFLLLVNVHSQKEDHPYLKQCETLSEICKNINGFTEIYEDVRIEEDEQESQGSFIEVADFIEQIAYQEESITEQQAKQLRQALMDFVVENNSCDLATMKENERLLSRANDRNGHCIQSVLDKLRKNIETKEGDKDQERIFKNIIFASKYENKVAEIRKAIYPFVFDGVHHINNEQQRQWLAIVEPLKLVEGLLLKHEDKKIYKECSDREICEQLSEFFSEELQSVDFMRIPKSISAERTLWREKGVGLTFVDWGNYINNKQAENKFVVLATIAKRVYGEIKKVIRE